MFDTSLYDDTYNMDNLNIIIIIRNVFLSIIDIHVVLYYSVCLCYIIMFKKALLI